MAALAHALRHPRNGQRGGRQRQEDQVAAIAPRVQLLKPSLMTEASERRLEREIPSCAGQNRSRCNITRPTVIAGPHNPPQP